MIFFPESTVEICILAAETVSHPQETPSNSFPITKQMTELLSEDFNLNSRK